MDRLVGGRKAEGPVGRPTHCVRSVLADPSQTEADPRERRADAEPG
jgi:hypothetical protein